MSKLDDIVSEAFRRVPLAGKTNFEHEEQLARQAARLAWNAAIEAAAKKCDEWDDYPEVTQVGLNIRKLGEGV